MNTGNKMGTYASILKTGKTNSDSSENMKPALLLDDSCIIEKDCMLSLMGKVKELGSMQNLYIILAK